jgi:hypothetical protein
LSDAYYEGEKLCLNIDRDPAIEHHFLISALRQFTKNKASGVLHAGFQGSQMPGRRPQQRFD